jgi:hypothetical protein
VARYSPIKLFQAQAPATSDISQYSSVGGQTILKQIIVTNTSSSAVTFGMSLVPAAVNMLDQNDCGVLVTGSLGSWSATAGTLAYSATTGFVLTAGSSSCAMSTASTGANSLLNVIAVSPSLTYSFSYYAAAGSTARTTTMQVFFYTSAGIYLNYQTLSGTDSTGGTQVQANITPPANAAYCYLGYSVTGAASSEVHYVRAFGMFVGASATYANGTSRVPTRIFPDSSVPALGVTMLDLSTVMNAGDFLSMKASVSSAVNVYASGVMVQ